MKKFIKYLVSVIVFLGNMYLGYLSDQPTFLFLFPATLVAICGYLLVDIIFEGKGVEDIGSNDYFGY